MEIEGGFVDLTLQLTAALLVLPPLLMLETDLVPLHFGECVE
jgi:hypothetical protein